MSEWYIADVNLILPFRKHLTCARTVAFHNLFGEEYFKKNSIRLLVDFTLCFVFQTWDVYEWPQYIYLSLHVKKTGKPGHIKLGALLCVCSMWARGCTPGGVYVAYLVFYSHARSELLYAVLCCVCVTSFERQLTPLFIDVPITLKLCSICTASEVFINSTARSVKHVYLDRWCHWSQYRYSHRNHPPSYTHRRSDSGLAHTLHTHNDTPISHTVRT